MDDIGMQLVAGLPIWFKMAFIAFVAIVGVFYVLPHVRRDKQGKWYWYSQKYEDNKRNCKQDRMLDEVTKFASDVRNISDKLEQHISNDKQIIALIQKDIDDSKQDRKEIHLDNLKQAIYLQEPFPMEERMYAGLRYISYGGNGTVKQYVVEELVKKNPITYKTIVTMRPELKVDGC